MRKLALVFMIGCLCTAAFAAGSEDASADKSGEPRMHPTYTIHYAKVKPEFKGDWEAYWNSPAWKQAGTIEVDQWTQDTTDNRPKTQAKVLYDETGIHVLWRVENDPYIITNAKKFMDKVSFDSCVEFFFEPAKDMGYINLETNACGVYLWRAQTWPKTADVKTSYATLRYRNYGKKEPPPEIGTKVQVRKSIEQDVLPEPITTPTTWFIETVFPVELLDWAYGIKAGDLPGATWRGNFYKIVEGKSPEIQAKKHFGAWANIGPGDANFHRPPFFGTLKFEKSGEKTPSAEKSPISNDALK